MNDFNTYFHFNYSSSGVIGKYVKLSIVIPYYGICSAICNKATKRVQMQTHKTTCTTRFTRQYIGKTSNGLIVGLDNLVSKWTDIDYSNRELLWACADHISTAANRLCKQLGGAAQFENIYNYARALRRQIYLLHTSGSCDPNELNGFSMPSPSAQTATEETPAPAPAQEPEWVRFQAGSVSATEIAEICNLLNQMSNPDEGIEYNGKRYRLFSENGYLVLKTSSVATMTYNTPEEPCPLPSIPAMPEPPPVPARMTKRMAFMVDDIDLTEFVKGCFYHICTDEIPDPGFAIILNSEGEKRTVSRSRIEEVDVYTEPPKEMATA